MILLRFSSEYWFQLKGEKIVQHWVKLENQVTVSVKFFKILNNRPACWQLFSQI